MPERTKLENECAFVDGLVNLVRQRDPHTAAHLDAVGVLAGRLARALDFGPDAITRITIAGRLHDIGMLALPLELIDAPRLLGESEWRKMHRHAELGESVIAGFPQLVQYRTIVRAHHERIDGSGYPDGLIGSDTPYQARIIAIADAFHSMTVAQPYTRAQMPDVALAEIVRCSGTQFEPDYVDAFVGMMEHRARDSQTSESTARSA
jgi:HD-GYP domain-containing protein (c-di-GMP phosphodiesterase class II)